MICLHMNILQYIYFSYFNLYFDDICCDVEQDKKKRYFEAMEYDVQNITKRITIIVSHVPVCY